MAAFAALITLRPEDAALAQRLVSGRSVLEWTIAHALACPSLEAVGFLGPRELVAIAESAGARPIGADDLQAFASVLHAGIVEGLVVIDGLAALVQPDDLARATALLLTADVDCVVATAGASTGTELTGNAIAPAGLRIPRAFHVVRASYLERTGQTLGGKTGACPVAVARTLDPATMGDWEAWQALAEVVLAGNIPAGPPIKLLVCDVDGVMTDAGFYYDTKGEALKKFNTRDGMGLVGLLHGGVELGLITGERSGFSVARAEKLGIKRMKLGCLNKLPTLDEWRRELGLEWAEVAYIGDDLPDVPCLRAVGVGACPRDAEPEVRAVSDYIARRDGGQGAIRDFINALARAGRVPPMVVK